MADFADFQGRARRMAELARQRMASDATEDWDEPTLVEPRDLVSAGSKRERLAGMSVNAEAARLVIDSAGCPVIVGHPGSEAAAKAAQRFVTDPTLRLLVIGGSTGRGKTVAAAWVAAVLDATWWLSARIVRVGDDWSHAHGRALRAAHLVIDDLGVEKNQWASDELGSVIEERTDRGLRTLVTTNLPPRSTDGGKSLLTCYGERFMSRLAQRPTSEYVVCAGPDLRRG